MTDMPFKDKIKTYLLLRLEDYVVRLRQGKWLGREASGRLLQWIDASLKRKRGNAS
jgi:hypothetical protein